MGGRPITVIDRRLFRSMTQWIAALHGLGTTLDELHQECIADAFTGAELGIER